MTQRPNQRPRQRPLNIYLVYALFSAVGALMLATYGHDMLGWTMVVLTLVAVRQEWRAWRSWRGDKA